MRRTLIAATALTVTLLAAASAFSDGFVAYSLRVSELQLKQNDGKDPKLTNLGGITSLAGMVYDEKSGDVIIVGKVNRGQPPISVDDLAVALRMVLAHKEFPIVSIDRTPETARTGKQKVFFQGHIEDTQFGKDLLDADVTLKKLSLGIVSAEVWGVRPYFARYVEQARTATTDEVIGSRFWFHIIGKPSFAVREGVFAIRRMEIGVKTEVMYVVSDGKPAEDASKRHDVLGDQFAADMTAAYPELCAAYPEIRRVKALLDLFALAKGLESNPPKASLDYWIRQYPVAKIQTPSEYKLLRQQAKAQTRQGDALEVEMNGGVELDVRVIRLKAGDVTALKEAVIQSRPNPDSLSWRVPLDGWVIPGAVNDAEIAPRNSAADPDQPPASGAQPTKGCCLEARVWREGRPAPLYEKAIPPLNAPMPAFEVYETLAFQRETPNIGGVMLSGTAQVTTDGSPVNLASGMFGLIVDGENATCDARTFQAFVTAAWAVYFGREDPGISIDPIAQGNKKQLVRYIGNVKNSDLGRVMREADYLMKQWAVGTKRPKLPGFQNPVEYGEKEGAICVGAMSRFWFVPQDMKFRATGDALIFDSGRMMVKTEFMANNARGLKADPANEDFARWFTEKYEQVAQEYPIYQELFKYAKLVSLAKYLKENRIPLFWFLMANKDLVLTEDSPGTVDSLTQEYPRLEGLHVEGGVDLASRNEYILDAAARTAIAEACRGRTGGNTQTGSPAARPIYAPEPVSVAVGQKSYTILPQYSASSGKDRRGIRYQTDFSIQAHGFMLTGSVLEALKPALVRRLAWDALRPPAAKPEVERLGKTDPHGKFDALYAETVQEAEKRTVDLLRKLALLKDKEYREEALFAQDVEFAVGKEQVERLGGVIAEYARYDTSFDLVRFFDPARRAEQGEFGPGWRLMIPYRLKPHGDARQKFLNVSLPTQMALLDLINGTSEILTFETVEGRVPGYYPADRKASQFVAVLLMTDGSYRLVDKIGCEFQFDAAGRLTDMIFANDHVLGVEYLEEATREFEQSPYGLEPDKDGGRVTFRNVELPKRIKVTDAFDATEVLTFNPDGKIVGYVPDEPKSSRYKILAILSDGSFRLADAHGNEIAFTQDGHFDEFAPNPADPVVRSMRMGTHRVNFKYAIARNGHVVISSAWVSRNEKGAAPIYVVNYRYDGESRMADRILQTAKGEPLGMVSR